MISMWVITRSLVTIACNVIIYSANAAKKLLTLEIV